jgi:hypothetical protein
MRNADRPSSSVMPGPVPGIHVLWVKGVDGRDKPGPDESK